MRVEQLIIDNSGTTAAALADSLSALNVIQPQLVLVFASPLWFARNDFLPTLRGALPGALLAGCSTAGEIGGGSVHNQSCVVTALRFAAAGPTLAMDSVANLEDSAAAGARLAQQLAPAVPGSVLLFAPGLDVNGSALVEGLAAGLQAGVRIMGGLAGDDGAFRQTWTLAGNSASSRGVVAIGLPASIQVGHGSFGGWKPFGPARKVTRCAGNILQELDGEPALAVYKRYLGDHAKDLPASGLLFPLEMLSADHSAVGLIRTILGVNEADGSLILAGDIQADGFLRLMHASTDALVDGAEAAANATREVLAMEPGKGLAILVSCVGRKLVMGGRVDEEVEAVGDVLGSAVTLTGFYSYGEISPFKTGGAGMECKLHNQTMTITCLAETA
jgi:hypothetical protein